MNSQTRTAINRQNAQHSTGPVTTEGKKAASLNATTHGLTAQQMILQPHEQAEQARLEESYLRDLRPKTELERDLVLKIIDCSLRLSRISVIENNIFSFSTLEHLRTENAQDPLMEFALAQSRAYLERANEIDKLSRYQSRISRQMLQYTKELSRLQKERRQLAEQRFLASKISDQAHTAQAVDKQARTAGMASFRQASAASVLPSSQAVARAVSPREIERKSAA